MKQHSVNITVNLILMLPLLAFQMNLYLWSDKYSFQIEKATARLTTGADQVLIQAL